MQVELDKAIDLNYNTECAAITYANVLLTWAVSNPVYVVYSIYAEINPNLTVIMLQYLRVC